MSVLKLFLSIIFIVNISTQFLNADARYMTEWTNPDGTKSKSPATFYSCLLYTSPSPRDKRQSRMPSSA